MGTASSDIKLAKEKYESLSALTPEEVKILQWRSNPQLNQFIPKVLFQNQKHKKVGIFTSKGLIQENVPLVVQHEQFIGNVTILTGKLSLEEALFTVKSLMDGHHAILNYFGKTLVSPQCCFLTKTGEIKAWINENYRKNTFSCQAPQVNSQLQEKEDLFLKPEDWVNHEKYLCSEAKAIQKIVNLVARLTCEINKYEQFLQCLDNFITGNILKNFNFERVKKFINKYIFQNKIFVKSNLLEVIERLYYENLIEQGSDYETQSTFSRESHVERRQSFRNTARQRVDQSRLEVSQSMLRNQISLEKTCMPRDSLQTRNSEFFNSTAYTNMNQSSKLVTNKSYLKEGYIYGSDCTSQISGSHFPDSIQMRQSCIKNNISHQYCMSFSTATEKVPENSRLYSLTPSLRSSVNSSKNSTNNLKVVDFKLVQNGLRPISQRKETDPEERNQKIKEVKQELKTSILEYKKGHRNSNGVSFGKRTNQITPIETKTNLVDGSNSSCVSISIKPETSPNFAVQTTLNQLKSNKELSEESMRRSSMTQNQFNMHSKKDTFRENGDYTNRNFLTVKTITRLISSNQNVSEQKQSEGDFSSIENQSSYSGVLASMGRSVEIINVPSHQNLQERTSKKTHTIFNTKCEYLSSKVQTPKSFGGFKKR